MLRKSNTMQGDKSPGFNGDHKTVEEIGTLPTEVFNSSMTNKWNRSVFVLKGSNSHIVIYKGNAQ